MKLAPKIREALNAKREEAKAAWQGYATMRDEYAAKGVDPAKDAEAFEALHEKHKEYAAVAETANDLEAKLFTALDMDGDAPTDSDPGRKRDADDPAAKLWTPGQRVLSSDVYKALIESGELNRPTRGDFKLGNIEASNRDELKMWIRAGASMKDLITGVSDTSAGALITPTRLPGVLEVLNRALVIRNLITVGDTDSDVVEWVRETGFTNAAAETAEATAATGTSGTKPESALALERVESNVRTIAHWIPATKRSLADAGQLRTLIDSRLIDGVNRRLDSQMINGNGTGENLRGILATTGVGTITYDAGELALEQVLRGMAQVRNAFLEPDAILMNPSDYVAFRLMRDDSGAGAGTGNYLFGPPSQAGADTLWGMRVVQNAVVPAGLIIVGKWDEAILWVREGANVTASDSHADYFTRNLVAILAEGRFAFGVPRPAAFSVVDIAA